MTPFMSDQNAYGTSLEVSKSRQADHSSSDTPNNFSKTYHATGEWGKRVMTLQELTRAFDAYNEDEERVAIGFASSEYCYRKLSESYRGVKTIFSDLDGLKPPSRSASFSLVPTTCSLRQSFLSASQTRYGFKHARVDELGYRILGDVDGGRSICDTYGVCHSGLEDNTDEDTIKSSNKLRQSLSMVSPSEAPSIVTSSSEHESEAETSGWDFAQAQRPSSRLGFVDDATDVDMD